jgi:hypothetical protein
MKLDKEFLETVTGPIQAVWQYIGSDSYAAAQECGERLTNEAALEGCIDAGRLIDCALGGGSKERGKLADAAVGEAIKQHGYKKVMTYLKRHIKLA